MSEITVIITAYNLSQYIESCLQELDNQTFKDFCILLVDDCSTDDTISRVKSYLQTSQLNLSLLSTGKNQGLPGRTRNYAMDSGYIQGKYAVFLDGDDSIEPDFLQKLYQTAEKNQADITVCAYDRFETETGHILCHEMTGFPEQVSLPTDCGTLPFINSSLWNKLIRTDRIGSCRMPDFRVGEDLCFCLALYEKCQKIVFIDQELIHYRVRRGSIISNTDADTIYQFANQMAYLWQQSNSADMRSALEETIFIHIGLSMSMRAYDNPEIDTRGMIGWITDQFRINYKFFEGNPFLKFSALCSHGISGIGVWTALICYRLGIYSSFLWLLKTMMRLFRIDFKF